MSRFASRPSVPLQLQIRVRSADMIEPAHHATPTQSLFPADFVAHKIGCLNQEVFAGHSSGI